MELLTQYVVLVVVAICLAVGYVIKNSLDFIPNKYIPLIMAVLGVFLNVWLNGWIIYPGNTFRRFSVRPGKYRGF